MKKRIVRYVFIILFSGIVCYLIYILGFYLIGKQEESHRVEGLKKKNIEGVIGAVLYLVDDKNYDYLTNDFDFIFIILFCK